MDILGRNKEAREQINLSLELNPTSYMMNALSALCYYHNAEYNKTIEESRKVHELGNDYHTILRILKCYVKLGMDKEAIGHIKNIVSIEASSNNHELIDKIYQKSGIEGIINWFIDWMLFNKSIKIMSTNSINYRIASFHAIIGNSQEAIEYLERGIEIGEYPMPRININPDFNDLRTDPKFIALLTRMRL